MIKTLATLSFSLIIASSGFAQYDVHFLNKTGRKVLVQNRTILEAGAFPLGLDANDPQYQKISLQTDASAILNIVAVPPSGPYGSGDGYHFLLKAGDSLIIGLDDRQKPFLSHISDPAKTESANFFRHHFAGINIPLPYMLYGMASAMGTARRIVRGNLSDRDHLLDSLYQPYISSVTEFARSQPMDPQVGEWFRYHYLGSRIGDKLYFDRNITDSLKRSLTRFYADSLNSWQDALRCENCQNIPAYNNALYTVYRFKYGKLKPAAFMDSVARSATGTNRNFVLSKFMADNIEDFDNDTLMMARYSRLCTDSIYRNQVLNSYAVHKTRSSPVPGEMGILLDENRREISFAKALSKLKGKTVYVDFWASWCQPCIAEFPSSHKLKEKLKGEDVEMLYISVDQNFDNWQTAAKRYQINGANSFLLTNAAKSELAKKIGLGPIPRYLIIDKNGRFEKLDAERPSDPDIYQVLKTALGK